MKKAQHFTAYNETQVFICLAQVGGKLDGAGVYARQPDDDSVHGGRQNLKNVFATGQVYDVCLVSIEHLAPRACVSKLADRGGETRYQMIHKDLSDESELVFAT